MNLVDELREVIEGEVDDSPETLEKYSRDASLFVLKPKVVARPKHVADIQALTKFVIEQRKKGRDLSLTPRAAGTDMSGGPLGDSIIVDVLAHMNKLIDLEGEYAVVEPGMFYKDFDVETQKKNLELPSYTASRNINTVGGMAANDSGGEKNLKYGKTAKYVEELEMVLADGEVYTLKNLSGAELQEKLKQESYEGELYRGVQKILSEYRDDIQKATPKVSKNSSGYALWDIGDGEESLNLARLMVGAQGTMGIITKIKYRLVRPKKKSSMVVVFVNDLSDLGNLVPMVLKHGPDSFESYDDKTFSLATKYFPEFALQMRANIISLGLSFLPEVWRLLTGGIPKLVLLVEFRADDQKEAFQKAQKLSAEVTAGGGNDISVSIAKNEKAAKKYWAVRRESFNLLRKKVRGKRTAPFIDDFVVPPNTLPEFLPKLNNILAEYDLTYTVAGHIGDGNFHIIPLLDPARKDVVKLISELSNRVYDLVLSYDGSISGEHNDGFIRTPFVEKMFGAKMVEAFKKTEALFDPNDIFNPGKKVEREPIESLKNLDLPGAKA
jgi:FAD/FMN-containing dehydrogenase